MWIKGHFLVSVLRFFPTNFKVGLTTQKIILTQTVNASFFQKHCFCLFWAQIMPWTLLRMPEFAHESLLELRAGTAHHPRKSASVHPWCCSLPAFAMLRTWSWSPCTSRPVTTPASDEALCQGFPVPFLSNHALCWSQSHFSGTEVSPSDCKLHEGEHHNWVLFGFMS